MQVHAHMYVKSRGWYQDRWFCLFVCLFVCLFETVPHDYALGTLLNKQCIQPKNVYLSIYFSFNNIMFSDYLLAMFLFVCLFSWFGG